MPPGPEHIEIPVGPLTFDALAVGPPGGELVLLLHGFPQSSHEWRAQLGALGAFGYRAVAPDQRGYSAGARPVGVEHYRAEPLVADVVGMADHLGADRFHLVGHDWGSIQGWAVVQDPRAGGRIIRYTSISGPDLRHFSRRIRGRFRKPRAWPQLGGQLLRSWYIAAFLVPVLPEAAWRLFLTRRYEKTAKRDVGNDPRQAWRRDGQ